MNNKGYSIKYVAHKTGLTPHVIRAWERRYAAISPGRTDTNRRLYTDADIERLSLLKRATSLGHSIGQVADMQVDELRQLVAEETGQATGVGRAQVTLLSSASASQYLESCLTAIANFDVQGTEGTLLQASVGLSQPVLMDELIVPLIHEVGERWQNGTFRVAHEHFASNILRTFLGNLRASVQLPETAPGMVATTPTGQLHELGALIAAITAATEGWRVIYLGPNLPAEEIAGAAMRNGVTLIGLSLIYPTNDLRLRQEMRKLRQGVGPEAEILVGGRAARLYGEILNDINATILTNLADLRTKLAHLI